LSRLFALPLEPASMLARISFTVGIAVAMVALISPELSAASSMCAAFSSQSCASPSLQDPDPYLDDRSNPEQLMRSYVNAINRHEYLRAYSYWEPAAAETELPPYQDFERGYRDTARVELTVGVVSGDAGAGQLYYSVPVALDATLTDGSEHLYVGCYILHLAQPTIQATPPFRPLAVRAATVDEVALDTDIDGALATACDR